MRINCAYPGGPLPPLSAAASPSLSLCLHHIQTAVLIANNDVVELKITYKSCNQNSSSNNNEDEKLKLLLAGTVGETGERERGRQRGQGSVPLSG